MERKCNILSIMERKCNILSVLIGLFYLPFIVGFCIPVIFERQTWVEIRQWLNQQQKTTKQKSNQEL
jgi:hypothetical protein